MDSKTFFFSIDGINKFVFKTQSIFTTCSSDFEIWHWLLYSKENVFVNIWTCDFFSCSPIISHFCHHYVWKFCEILFFHYNKINYSLQPEEGMYDPRLLAKLDFSRSITKFNPPITAVNTGEPWLKVRPLQIGDYDRGFLQLLSQLTNVGNITRDEFLARFYKMKYSGDYYLTVIEDTRINQVIGAATLVIEYKFIHECGLVCYFSYERVRKAYLSTPILNMYLKKSYSIQILSKHFSFFYS